MLFYIIPPPLPNKVKNEKGDICIRLSKALFLFSFHHSSIVHTLWKLELPWLLSPNLPSNRPLLRKWYLSKSLCGVNFIIDITKGFLENKVETLVIYKLIKSAYNNRYFERGDYSKYVEKDWLYIWGKSLRISFFIYLSNLSFIWNYSLFLRKYFWPVMTLFKYLMSFMM